MLILILFLNLVNLKNFKNTEGISFWCLSGLMIIRQMKMVYLAS